MHECIREFPKKDLKVVDLIHYLGNKDDVTIIYDDGGETTKELFDGRVEDLEFTKEGCLHPAALCPLEWIEASTDGKLLIFVSDISCMESNSNDESANNNTPADACSDQNTEISFKSIVNLQSLEAKRLYVDVYNQLLRTYFSEKFGEDGEIDISYMVKDFYLLKSALRPICKITGMMGPIAIVRFEDNYMFVQYDFARDTANYMLSPDDVVTGVVYIEDVIKKEYL